MYLSSVRTFTENKLLGFLISTIAYPKTKEGTIFPKLFCKSPEYKLSVCHFHSLDLQNNDRKHLSKRSRGLGEIYLEVA